MSYPSYEELIKGVNPERLLITRRSILSIFPRLLVFGLFIFVLLFLGFTTDFGNETTIAWSIGYIYRFLSFIPCIILLDILRIYYNDKYILSAKKITREQGIISTQYSVPSVSYSDIRGIVIDQGIWGRLLNYGDVKLGTAAYEGHELILEGIYDPNTMAGIIERFRVEAQEDVDTYSDS